MKKMLSAMPLLVALAPVTSSRAAGFSDPVAAPIPDRVPHAVDTPYPGGTIALDIDASDLQNAVWHVTERIPVAAGTREITLLFPQWLPGHHSGYGPIYQIADLHFFVGGKELDWDRDAYNVYAFHLKLPEGTGQVVAKFVDTTPLRGSEGRIVVTQEMLNLQWTQTSLYPAGYYVRDINFKPTVTFPKDWTVYTALDGMTRSGDTVTWDPVNYEELVDSPIFAGKYAKRWDLGHSVHIDVVADKAKQLDIAPENFDTYKSLVEQALLAFGSRHFDHYDFLLALTDRMGGIGLEHHRSSENQMEPEDWIKWADYGWDRNVIAHEFSHSWNGKFRRPEGLWTPDYREPMKDDLLWVYEGQTQFWGLVLAARSGVQSKDVVLGQLASAAGYYSIQPGRQWRSVEDTTRDPIIANRRALPNPSLSRSEDYYEEGALIWIEADQIIRQGTNGKKGLDDFAKAFFGIRDGDWGEVTYDFDDVVETLSSVYHYDWATFLKTRLYEDAQPAAVKGIEMAGYKLVWKENPNPYDKGQMDYAKRLDLAYSLGVAVKDDGTVASVIWDSPAFNAGVVNGTQIVAVNGDAYSEDAMKDAITAAKGGKGAIELLLKRGDRYFTVKIDYHDGLRFPWLERAAPGNEPAPLDRLLAPRKTA